MLKLKISVIFFIVILMLGNLTFADEDTSASQVESINLSGEWLSDLVDDMMLKQNGNRITGTYQYMNDSDVIKHGEIEGTIEGKRIQAKWWEYPSREGGKRGEESQGELEWTISNNGKQLTGWYREDGERDEGEPEKHEWNMER